MSKLRTGYSVVVISLCIVALAAGVAWAAISVAMAEKVLRTKIDENWTTKNLKITVKPYSSEARTQKGQFAYLAMSADWAEEKEDKVKLVDFSMSARDVQIDVNELVKRKKLRVVNSGSTSAHVKLMEADVNRLLAMKKTPIQNLKVDFGNGDLTFTGKYQVNIKLTGTVEIKNGYELHFKPTQASIGILGVPIGIVNKFLGSLNPVMDMRKLPLQPKLKSLKITPTYMEVIG
ncbi:MAG: DUF2993 domain-containing protein [Armatimonadetes bacterium]|jgi:hypothetical protein|nr:DUF2993 domain-containing protein [Armatimonadota bacterium]MDI9584079.1 DUF2993 domain-containing protein [Acidobacteriota bacterium]